VLWQSQRDAAYRAALQSLQDAGLLYRCSCTRRETAQGPYDGRCRNGPGGDGPYAWRLRLPEGGGYHFTDTLQGEQHGSWASLGDPVLVRRDGLVAYQLAVVVDDAFQDISHVVRGADLLPATGWQLALIDALNLPVPRYTHLPVLMGADGQKLSKSRSAAALDALTPVAALYQALTLLRQQPPARLADATVPQVLDWAVKQWNPLPLNAVASVEELALPD
jgi:glutamyl-Q tRNA(Asp) synthetase